MNRIVVGIPTYRRPLMLKKLINSLYACSINLDLIDSIRVIVIDNDDSGSAAAIIQELLHERPKNFDLDYVSFPLKGLSNVRNKILEEAFNFDPDFILSIDDDEYVVTNWFNEMINTAVVCKADVVLGPVVPDFEDKNLPAYVSKYFQRPVRKDQELLNELRTGNILLRTTFLIENNITFDERFNATGAEDTFFGIQVGKKLGKIHWAAHAIAFETISKERSTLDWLIKRTYRTAITYTYILTLEKSYGLLMKKFCVSVLYILMGILGLVFLPFRINNKYFGVLKIAEGLGGFAGLFSFKYNEYD